MANDRHTAYARALVSVAAAEGELRAFTEEFSAIAQAVGSSDQLVETLSDLTIPPARRAQIIEDLLDTKAAGATVSLVSMVVSNGRARDLPGIAEAVAAQVATEAGRDLAIVRTALDLTDEQRARLTTALSQAVGNPVDVRVVVDPGVLGGIVAQVGDTVIDGSVRRRLDQLKQAI